MPLCYCFSFCFAKAKVKASPGLTLLQNNAGQTPVLKAVQNHQAPEANIDDAPKAPTADCPDACATLEAPAVSSVAQIPVVTDAGVPQEEITLEDDNMSQEEITLADVPVTAIAQSLIESRQHVTDADGVDKALPAINIGSYVRTHDGKAGIVAVWVADQGRWGVDLADGTKLAYLPSDLIVERLANAIVVGSYVRTRDGKFGTVEVWLASMGRWGIGASDGTKLAYLPAELSVVH